METALDDIGFLANSENRVEVIEALVQGPRSRDEIRGRVDASRVTIARILRELEARMWVSNSGLNYEITPLGEWVYAEFSHLVDEVEAEQRLRDAIQWLPSDELPFDIRCLSDAEIVVLDGSDATAMVRRIAEFQRAGTTVRGFTRCIAPAIIETHWELTVQQDRRIELVFAPEAMDVVQSEQTSARHVHEILTEGNAQYFVSDAITLSVAIVDGTVALNLTDDAGVLKGGVITEHPTVHDWAVDRFETLRDDAEPVAPETTVA